MGHVFATNPLLTPWVAPGLPGGHPLGMAADTRIRPEKRIHICASLADGSGKFCANAHVLRFVYFTLIEHNNLVSILLSSVNMTVSLRYMSLVIAKNCLK